MIIVVALLFAIPATGWLVLQNSRVQTHLTGKIAHLISQRTNAKISIGKVDISFFKNLVLNDVLIATQNDDTIFFSRSVSAKIDTLRIRKKIVSLSELTLDSNCIHIFRDSTGYFNFSSIVDSLHIKKDTATFRPWDISLHRFNFNRSRLIYKNLASSKSQEFYIRNLNALVTSFSNYKDTICFTLDQFNLDLDRWLRVENAQADFLAAKNLILVQNMHLKTRQSNINGLNFTLNYNKSASGKKTYPDINMELLRSTVNFGEFSAIFPQIKGMNQTVEFSGQIYGNSNDLKGRDIVLKTGNQTRAGFNFYVNDLSDLKNMYLFVDLKYLETTFEDINAFHFPFSMNVKKLDFPESLYQAGLLSYKGNFSGFLSDFVAYGTFTSDLGIVRTDLSVVPHKDNSFHYNGKLSTTDFQLNKISSIGELGKISFNAEVDGNYNLKSEIAEGTFNGEISKLEANGYKYRNIMLDGLFLEKMFDGKVTVNDSNLQFTFLGELNLKNELPSFDFNLQVDKILPNELNLGNRFPKAELAFTTRAKFIGNKIDNIKGLILIDDGYYKNRYGEFSLKGTQLFSVPGEKSSELTFSSDYFDFTVNGIYNFMDIRHAVQKIVDRFLPSFNFKAVKNPMPNAFDFKVNAKNLNPLTKVFVPELAIEKPFFLYGKMDSHNAELNIEGSIPGIQYKTLWFRNIFIGNKIVNDHYASKFNIGEIVNKRGASVFNLSIDSEIANNHLVNQVSWNATRDSTSHSVIKTKSVFTQNSKSVYPAIDVQFFPSKLFFADDFWDFEGFSAKIDTSEIMIKGFNLHNDEQHFEINGKISKDSTQVLLLKFGNMNLNKLFATTKKGSSLHGLLNGKINLSDLYHKPVIIANANIDQLEFKNQMVGNVNLYSSWNPINYSVDTELDIVNKNHKRLMATGYYNANTGDINYTVQADSLPVKLLETVILSQFSDFSGFASGQLKLGGNLSKITMDGAVKVDEGSIKIDYTQVTYFLDDSIFFKTDTILFDNITIRDVKNNTGNFYGTLVHNNFKDMRYDISVSSPKILALKTTYSDNQVFYGDVYGNCKLNVTGQGKSIYINGLATTLPGSSVNINMEYQSELEQYNFIEFINNADENDEQDFFITSSDFNLGLTIEATPSARVQLIYNSQIGDVIKAQGEGILLFNMNKDGDITLSGNYTITRGDYLFTLQNIINKRFTIAPGGTISWSGDPYNAIIDISAIYKLKASLADLPLSTYAGTESRYVRIPVESVIHLTNELTNPSIDFEVKFPEENTGVKNELMQFFNTDEEKNKQILSLIVLGKFYTPEYMRGQYEAQNPSMIGTTASELFSNQLSNWLSKINSNLDVGFNYRPGNRITNDELELALSTQLLNDRVTLNGNIGNNVNPESSNNSQIVGDFDIRVKLIPSGKIEFKAFNHSNNNLIYETAPYTQGIGFTFKEKYNTLGDLFKKWVYSSKRRKSKK